MSDLKTQFETAAEEVQKLPEAAGRQDPAHPVRLLQAGHRRGCDRRPARRLRHGGQGEVRRLGQAQGHVAGDGDAGVC